MSAELLRHLQKCGAILVSVRSAILRVSMQRDSEREVLTFWICSILQHAA